MGAGARAVAGKEGGGSSAVAVSRGRSWSQGQVRLRSGVRVESRRCWLVCLLWVAGAWGLPSHAFQRRASGWGDGGEAAGQDGSWSWVGVREGGPRPSKASKWPRSPLPGFQNPVSRIQVWVVVGGGGCGEREACFCCRQQILDTDQAGRQTDRQTHTHTNRHGRTARQKPQNRRIAPNLPARLVSSRLGWPAATISGQCRCSCSAGPRPQEK